MAVLTVKNNDGTQPIEGIPVKVNGVYAGKTAPDGTIDIGSGGTVDVNPNTDPAYNPAWLPKQTLMTGDGSVQLQPSL